MSKLLIDKIIAQKISELPLGRVTHIIPRASNKIQGKATMSLVNSNKYSFDETETDYQDAKIAFNKILNELPFIMDDQWKMIIENLNKNAIKGGVQKVVTCYIISLIKFISAYGKNLDISFAKDKESNYIYTSKYWAKVIDDLLKRFLRDAALRLGIPEGQARDDKFLKGALNQFMSEGFYEMKKETGISYLNLNNGTLKITNNSTELLDFDEKIFQNYILDYDFDPESTNQEWIDFIKEVVPDGDTRKTLQQSLGYLFVKDLKLEKTFFLYGNGANGKSVVFEVIKGLLPEEMITHNTLTDLCTHNSTSTYYKYHLNDKLINYASDITLKGINAASFKSLVSGEPQTVRQIKGKTFLMKDYAKLIFNINKLEDASVENTDGFFRRIIVIPFEISIPPERQDKRLHNKLLKNKSGIINWILEGLEEVRKNEAIFESDKCKEVVENFKKTASPIQSFIEELEIKIATEESNENISFKDMFERYKKYCDSNKEKHTPQRVFNADLKRLGFLFKKRKQGNVWFAKFGSNNKTNEQSKDEASKETQELLDIINN